MPRYRDRQTGRVITVEGGDPTDEELDSMFADGGDTFRMRAAAPDRTSTVRPIPPGVRPGPLGGPNASMSAGEPEGALSRGYGAVKEAIFGHPDRAEAREAGIGLQPTPAEMAGTVVGLGGSALAGGGAGRLAAMAGPTVARAVGAAGRVAMNPVVAGGVAGAVDLASGGNLKSAATEALLVGGLASGVRGARAKVAPKPQPRSRPRAVPSAPSKEPSQGAPKATVAPAATPQKAAPVTQSRGAEAAARHNEHMQFAKKIAAENPKVGEKIWILLDEAGKPIKTLTSDQAAAAKRKGLQTTWVRNLWSAS